MEFKFEIKDLVETEGGIVKVDHTLTPIGWEEDEKYGFKLCRIIHRTITLN